MSESHPQPLRFIGDRMVSDSVVAEPRVVPEQPLAKGLLPLRLGLAFLCAGLAMHLWYYDGPVFSYLFMHLHWGEAAALQLIRGAAIALLLLIPLVFFRRTWPLMVMLMLWGLAEMLASFAQHPAYYHLLPLALAVRYLAPLSYMLIVAGKARMGFWLLRWALAVTFAAHGVEALMQHPQFLDLILMAFRRLDFPISESVASNLMVPIGIMDLLLAVILLLGRWRWLLFYMCFWGLITAFSRMLHSGWDGLDACMVRLLHGLVPLTLLYHFSQTSHASKP